MKHFWKKRIPAFLLALVLVTSLLPVASAKTTSVDYTVKAGDTVSFSGTDFEAFFDSFKSIGDTFISVDFGSQGLRESDGTLYYGKSTVISADNALRYSFDLTGKSKNGKLDDLSFKADKNAKGTMTLDFQLLYEKKGGSRAYHPGEVRITVGDRTTPSHGGSGSSNVKADLTYTVDPGKTVDFYRRDFSAYYEDNCRGDFGYVTFYPDRTLDDNGTLYYDYGGRDETYFEYKELKSKDFYYRGSSRDYEIDYLTYEAGKNADGEVVLVDFTVYGTDTTGSKDRTDYMDGVLAIQIGTPKKPEIKADLSYEVVPGKMVDFDRRDFSTYYVDNCRGDFDYVTFYPDRTLDDNGTLYYDYGGRDETYFEYKELKSKDFYYRGSSRDYEIDYLTYEAGKNADGEVVLVDFTVYGTDTTGSKDRIDSMDGVLAIRIGDVSSKDPVKPDANHATSADIRYFTTSDLPVQINANDINRFFSKKFPKDTLQYVSLDATPSAGMLFYDLYSVSPYGNQKQLTDKNVDDQVFYFSPRNEKDFSLSELTYVPVGVNYCTIIPFTAYGSSKSASVSGNIYISATLKKVPEVYGVTPGNTAVSFPAAALNSAVSNATGSILAGIMLLDLPDSSVGTITTGSGVTLKADTETRYGYSNGTWLMSQLHFTPAKDYTGPVEIPYAAYDSEDNVFAAGKLCLGVVNKIHKFKDITSATWCYKYVTELADAGIIDGYKDGSFKEKNPLTYGAALKLVMLAAGYPEQAPTVKGSVFSGYLDRARKDGLVSGKINLTASITRLEVSRLAAKALKLDIDNLSSVQPFTDTKDPYVQALSAAGIVNGYFDNGTSTFKPNNSLTRGHISAIVWRMNQYRK